MNTEQSSENVVYDNLDDPFITNKITPLDYNSDENSEGQFILIYNWLLEFNYDYYQLQNIFLFSDKNNSDCKSYIDKIKEIRNTPNQTSQSGDVIKLNNTISLKQGSLVYIYLIVYYDNVKCNIKYYGLFTEQIDTKILIDQIIKDKKYGSIGRMHEPIMTSTLGNGFNIIQYPVTVL